jgi:hypothetical protein
MEHSKESQSVKNLALEKNILLLELFKKHLHQGNCIVPLEVIDVTITTLIMCKEGQRDDT